MVLVGVEIRPVADRYLVTTTFCSSEGLGHQELTVWANTLSQATKLSQLMLLSHLSDEEQPA